MSHFSEAIDVRARTVSPEVFIGLPDHVIMAARYDKRVQQGTRWLLLERKVVLDIDAIPGSVF